MKNLHENELITDVLNLCFSIHSDLGPGLYESVYEEVLAYELTAHNFHYKRQVDIPLFYKGLSLDKAFRADFIIENKLLVELKSTEELSKTYYKQVYTYLKLSNLRLGLLINFNVGLLKDGIKRVANNLQPLNM